MHDVRYAIRLLAKRPLFSALIILSLALGIGANTAIFSAINAVMLKMFPVYHPQQLKMLTWTVPTPDFPETYVEDIEGSFIRASALVWQLLVFLPRLPADRREQPVLRYHFRFRCQRPDVNVGLNGHASSSPILVGVSGNFLLGMEYLSVAGRATQPSDDTDHAAPVGVISHRFWQSQFGGQLSASGTRSRWMAIRDDRGCRPSRVLRCEPGLAPDVWVTLHWYAAGWAKLNGAPTPDFLQQ